MVAASSKNATEGCNALCRDNKLVCDVLWDRLARLLCMVSIIVMAVWAAEETASARRMTASVTVDAFRNTMSGMIFSCIDPIPFGCGRGDFYASVFMMRGADGTAVNCGPTAPTINLDNLVPPSPPWTCSTDITGLVAPVTLFLRIHDFDGRFVNAIDGDDAVDIGAGFTSESLIPVPVGTSTSTFTGSNGSVTLTFVGANVPVTLLNPSGAMQFDPRLGETGQFTFDIGNPDESISLSTEVVDSANIVIDTTTAIETATGSFIVDWDGRDTANVPFPVGTYRIRVSATDGASTDTLISSGIQIINRTDALRLASLDTPVWWLTSGALRARIFAATPTFAELAIFQGQNCEPANRASTLTSRTWAGFTDFQWNGIMVSGTRSGLAVNNGLYSVGLRQGSVSFGCLPLEVVSAPTIRVYIEADPAVPIDGGTSTIRVVALSDTNQPRRTDTISIFIANAATLASGTAPTTPATICRSTSMCTVPAPAASNPGVTEPFAYNAIASDANVGTMTAPPLAVTGWRVSHRTALATITAGARPNLAAGVAQQSFGTFSLAHALDVGYRPGSGYNISNSAGWNDFMRAIRDTHRTMFGLDTKVVRWPTQNIFSSALASTPQAYSQWAIPLPVSVAPRIFTSTSSDQICTTNSLNNGTFDAVGILHLIQCRDNATSLSSPSYFTAKGPSIAWHELHHALYGLSDEYDGRRVAPLSFDLPGPPRNIFDNVVECSTDPLGTVAGACTEVSLNFAGLPFVPSGRFRLDANTTNDVMVLNGSLEQGADVRRVRQRTTQCGGGVC
jgi:hypothetical protein